MSSREWCALRAGAFVAAAAAAAALVACSAPREPDAAALARGDAGRGKAAIQHYGCNACHAIAGFPDPSVVTAAPVTGIVDRAYIAGTLSNTPENLVLWIRFPHRVKPQTAMPDMGVSEQQARDIATYLYSLR